MKQKRKLATLAATTGLIGIIGVGSTLAYFTDSDAATNIIETGKVDISLFETKDNRDGTLEEVTSLIFENVMPGDLLAKDPFIRMESGSADAYLRVKLDIVSNTETALTEQQTSGILDLVLTQMNENGWYLGAGDYYYYNDIATVSSDDSRYYIFKELDIPTEWNNDFADLNFNINLTAEATQAKNFEQNIVRVDGNIYAWSHDDVTALSISFDGSDSYTLIADANGNVTLPDSVSDGWYDDTNHICYKNGETVAASRLTNTAAMKSVALEEIAVTINCHDTASEGAGYFETEPISFCLPVFDGEQSDVYVDVSHYVPEKEGYTTSAVSFNGNGVSYCGGQIAVAKGFYINTADKRPIGPGKYEQYTSVYSIRNNNTNKVWIRGYEEDSFVLLCNYIKNN